MMAAQGGISNSNSNNTRGRGGGFGFASRSGAGREPGVRDFLKLCARVQTLGVFDGQEDELEVSMAAGDDGDDDELEGEDSWFCSEAQALPVVVESLEVFAGHLTSKEALAHAAEVVAGLWNVLPSRASELATTARPEFVQGEEYLKIGRVTLPRLAQMRSGGSSSFAPTSHALRLMETLAASVRACEPVLLVGETGCGKTALVQRLAEGTGRELVVQNLSLQTDGADLLGGFRPVELRQLAQEVLEEFLRLFPLLFSATQNARFCQAITSSFERRQWSRLSKGLANAAKMAMDKLDRSRFEQRSEASSDFSKPDQHAKGNKVQRSAAGGGSASPSGQRRDWERFASNAKRFERQRIAVEGSFAFSFVEGVLVKAIREGKWVLLDEINLASAETLQRLSGLLEGAEGSLCLTERGDIDPVVRNKDFRLFAAMNPPTDASKKDLPPALRRSRFSEVYVPELEDRTDLKQVVDGYISGVAVDHESLAFTAVDLYLWARGLSAESLSDGAGQRPRYSLRTLVGAVSSARRLVDRGFSPKRAMVEGFRASFETQLDGDGRAKILKGILRAFGKGMTSKDLEKPPRRPGGRAATGTNAAPWVRIGTFWLEGGPLDTVDAAELDPDTKQRRFVLTSSVEGTLRCLARAVASADSPVLLQGPTSAGKTSIVEYLAARLGHRCVRINNHEHTDIQEYTGSYAADGSGKLAFQEGVLVESLRKGYWIILDELNLAPSEVLEALNRLLDHNRELYLSETQETIKPHTNFRLFATQNPPGAYGGRKPLSRAFRNRFMEVHVDDIPGEEWEVILAERCALPPTHCKLLVKVLHELQAQRQSSRLFLGKHGAISPRDLLRWAGRKPQGKQQLAEEGYMLLAERLRSEEEKVAMRRVLEEQIGVPLDPDCLYGTAVAPSQQDGEGPRSEQRATSAGDAACSSGPAAEDVDETDLGGFSQLSVVEGMLDRGQGLDAGLQGVAMTKHMRRLFRLSGRCLSHEEPLLLVGATGCGKTTVCQLYSMLLQRRMHVVNCHQNTEAADLLGGLRPMRGRDLLVKELRERGRDFLKRCRAVVGGNGNDGPTDGNSSCAPNDLDRLDVAGIIAAVQVAWTKVSQQQTGLENTSSTTSAFPARGTAVKQKRARPVEDPQASATLSGGVGNTDGQKATCSSQADVPTAVDVTASTVDSRRTKGGRAKRRRAAAAVEPAGVGAESEVPKTSSSQILQSSTPAPTETNAMWSLDPRATLDVSAMDELETEFVFLKGLAVRSKGLFEWVDGPLVTAMRNGELILLDELSLAEDAVLERLNSVLEPGRSITLAEKGGEGAGGAQGAAQTVVAAPGFRVMATMNPGGDFGKRELSPALRSRFTEVWVPALSDREDMEGVVQKAFRFGDQRLSEVTTGLALTQMASPMLDFAWWFNNTASSSLGGGHGLSLSVRDLLSWAGFITSSLSPSPTGADVAIAPQAPPSTTTTTPSSAPNSSCRRLTPWEAYVHGAALVLLDGLGLGAGLSPASVVRLRRACAQVLEKQIPESCAEHDAAVAQLGRDGGIEASELTALGFEVREISAVDLAMEENLEDTIVGPRSRGAEFGVAPFFTACGPRKAVGPADSELDFSVRAPTTSKNLYRVLRALQVRKAVLLEGSPGVGKTSLISALAAATGHELVRINLSEQTDVSDLFGSDLPVPEDESAGLSAEGSEQGTSARFAWCDGVFLSALKAGKWVLLDELNLATQSVLEGLNACLDHRAEVYIPELGRSFRCPSTFKVFAAQNPLGQGGGRKGLPKSFLSRFTKVFVDPLTPDDLLYIAASKFPLLAASPTPLFSASVVVPELVDGERPPVHVTERTNKELLSRMIAFNSLVQSDTMEARRYGRKGSPWEFNLRDVFRWCELLLREQQRSSSLNIASRTVASDDWEPWTMVDTLYIQRMRTRADRDAILGRFKEAFPEAFLQASSNEQFDSGPRLGGIGTHPVLTMTPEWMQIGRTVLRRGCWSDVPSRGAHGEGGLKNGLSMPVTLRRPLQALARCVAMGWPALVVGHRGSGKSRVIEGLAAAVGARLTEVAMTPSVDVTELLGCFEQTDAKSAHESLLEAVGVLAQETCLSLVAGPHSPSWDETHAAASVWNGLHSVRCAYRSAMSPRLNSPSQDDAAGFSAEGMVAVQHLISTVKTIIESSLDTRCLSTTSKPTGATAAGGPIPRLRRKADQASVLADTVLRQVARMHSGSGNTADSAGAKGASHEGPSASCFRWNDGVLVEALERGDWVVLDGANLCSASVLDRLNPLLEPGGVLPLTECGTAPNQDLSDEQPETTGVGDQSMGVDTASASLPSSTHRVIRPHPNFRLFLTADPSCGEVSRAMRNRCVEISLLDAPPAVAVVPPSTASTTAFGGNASSPVVPVTEHAADLLALVRLGGLTDPAEAAAAIAVHSALVSRRSRGKENSSSGEGPSPRLLLLWAELTVASRARTCDPSTGDGSVDDLRRCLPLAYPGLSPGVGASAEAKLAETILSSCLRGDRSELKVPSTSRLLETLVACGWMDIVHDSIIGQVSHDAKVLKTACIYACPAGLTEEDERLMSVVVQLPYGEGGQARSFTSSDLRLDADDAFLLHTADVTRSNSSSARELVAYAMALFVRRASWLDRPVRVASAARLAHATLIPHRTFQRSALSMGLGEAALAMMTALYESAAWGEASAMLSEMANGVGSQDASTSSLRQAMSHATDLSAPADPRTNPELFCSMERVCGECRAWAPLLLLLNLIDVSISRRLPLLLAEQAELSEARDRLGSGRRDDAGLGWLGLSCLVCEGGRESAMIGGGRVGGGCSETRLARSALLPLLLPLFRAVDGVTEALVCRRAAELAVAGGSEFAQEVRRAVTAVLQARDTISCLFSPSPSPEVNEPGADASGGGVSTKRSDEMVFAWDSFLVAWRWQEQAVLELRTALSGSAPMADLDNVATAFATLSAVAARVNGAVLQHAGGAVPARDTLWKYGPRAAAPSSAAGATAIAQLRLLADEFRILPPSSHDGRDGTCVSLSTLMREAHPALCVGLETRREFLHALCTLQWAASTEQENVSSGGQSSQHSSNPLFANAAGVKITSDATDAPSLAASMPGVLGATLRAARTRFEAEHKGTRLGAVEGRDDGLEHHQDDLEFGEKFDDFDTEAAEAVSNATLLVVSGGGDGAGGGDLAGGGGKASGAGVLQNWASIQLSPLMEHWIVVEECHILASLAKVDAGIPLVPQGLDADAGEHDLAAIMARVARLRSAMLATPSLSPLASRPYQTLLWAHDDPISWTDVRGTLLTRLLPVAMESFGSRLWESVVANPAAISLGLAPPDMVVQPTEDGGSRHGTPVSVSGGGEDASAGPTQLMKLARTSFLLRLSSTASFRGGVVPGACGGGRNGVDLTLMNASARLGQYRMAIRGVRDLGYVRSASDASGALEPLVEMSWARLCRTLQAFDQLGGDTAGVHAGGQPTFAKALRSATAATSVAFAGESESSVSARTQVEDPLRKALKGCTDERLVAQGEALVLPAMIHLSRAMSAFTRPMLEGPTPAVEATAGLGIALLGCLKLVLLLPSTPVDPGLRPALKKELLAGRLERVKGELTVKHWSRRLEGGGDVCHEMLPLLQQARGLRDECVRLGLEAIERPEPRPGFHALFRDVYAFARGVGNPSRVKVLAQSLARLAGVTFAGNQKGGQEGFGARNDSTSRATLLQEEAIWQGAAGAFVRRCREEYGEAYVDVITGICDAVEIVRTGLRVLASSCASRSQGAAVSPTARTAAVDPMARLQGTLLSFPYPCHEGLTAVGDWSGDGLRETLQMALGTKGLEDVGEIGGAGKGGLGSGPQHMMLLQAVLSRAELLLSSGCSTRPALEAAASAMEGAVAAWSRLEAQEAEKRRKEAEILKYKMQEHLVESEEATDLAKLRSLFPDYHSVFEDLVRDPAQADHDESSVGGDASGAEAEGDEVDARVKALGHMSDKQLSVVVARHCRIFLSLCDRRRRQVQRLLSPSSTRLERSLAASGAGGRAGSPAASSHTCSDAVRVAAFVDSYRASVLLAGSSSRLPSSIVLTPPTFEGTSVGDDGKSAKEQAPVVVHLEEAFAGSHLLALANASRLCKSGKTLLDDAVGGGERSTTAALKKKAVKELKPGGNSGGVSGGGWLGEGAVGRNLLLVDSVVNFHLDANVGETRLADGPLAAVLKRVANLLEEFPGHGVLIQLARVADRVRRMPLHSPLAAVLAGVELTLRKAQDWEQHAHRGVSLKEELRTLSSLVVRWRAVELKSWPHLLDAREDSFVLKANRWWLHLYRLLTGEWSDDVRAPNPLQAHPDSDDDRPATPKDIPGQVFESPDWPSARACFPNWVWSGLMSDEESLKKDGDIKEAVGAGTDSASLDHARGLFQSLDDFLRTSTVGEFFARLQMLRAFAAQLSLSYGDGGDVASSPHRGERALATVVQGLWEYYSQFTEDVLNARSLVRRSIEKKLKEEAKLAKWDEQTYYSLAETSEKSHRKLSKLVSQYDEVLEVSVSEVLHRTFVAGIGERQEGNAPNPTAPCTEIPSLGTMFSAVKKVDSAADFDDDEEHVQDDVGKRKEGRGVGVSIPDDEKMLPTNVKPAKLKRLTSRSATAPGNSLEILDACLPGEPGVILQSFTTSSSSKAPDAATVMSETLPLWLRQAIFATSSDEPLHATVPLTARLTPLAHRMRSLLLRGIYARQRADKTISMGVKSGGWAEGGRPAGFVGAGLAEELCLAVFGRIQSLRAKAVGKQVKKRAVLDLLGGMRKQGILYAKSNTPGQTSDMLNVMALARPFSEDRLAGLEAGWLFHGDGSSGHGNVRGRFCADLSRRGERYYLRGLNELSRLRLEAGAPVSKDITRREAEVMRGLAEHLGLLVLQQRSATTALESDLTALIQEVRALHSLTADYSKVSSDAACGAKSLTRPREGDEPQQAEEQPELRGWGDVRLPPQTPLRSALATLRRGLLRGLEAVREVQLLLKAVAGADAPLLSSPSRSSSREARLRRAKGGEGWGEAAIDAETLTELESAVDALEQSLMEMQAEVERYPSPAAAVMGSAVEPPLLAAAAVRVVSGARARLRACSARAASISETYAGVVPPGVLRRVAHHLSDAGNRVAFALNESPVMRAWLLDSGTREGDDGANTDDAAPSAGRQQKCQRQAAAKHASKVGQHLTESVKALLLSVQALCQRDTTASVGSRSVSDVAKGRKPEVDDGGQPEADEGDEEEDSWSTDTTLFEAHASAFEQARGLKLWRCAAALHATQLALKEFSEDEAVTGARASGGDAAEATAALMLICGDLTVLAEQVVSAGKAVLIGMIAFNKGTAKLHYVTVRVFRTLLSKGLCAAETEDDAGDGDGDIDGMKFDDDVEGTGMGEGEGKKDVTDQIEDEEQLLGLKGDEPDRDQAEESKELGEDEQDKGMEMENDFEGEMFDVPKGDENDDKDENGDDKEELDREMGDLGDDADVVDEKLWNEDDDEEEEDGQEQGEEKFEAGSRLDGEKPEEDEIRTKEDGQDEADQGGEKDDATEEGKDEDKSKGKEDVTDDAKKEDDDEGQPDQEDGDDGVDGEGPVNDDLEDNYEDKPMGVEVRGEDEAMEVDEEGREGDGDGEEEEKDGKGEEEEDTDMPDDLNLDNEQAE
ncbi:unnamed protein product, partial [Scytosiphon promiscuus]